MLCLEYPGWQALVLRRESNDLQQSLIRRFLAKVPAELYTWREGTSQGFAAHTAIFRNAGDSPNGQPSTIRFAHCKDPDDVYRFKSDEYDSIHIDELTTFTYPMVRYLKTRLRATQPGHVPKITGATNPEGVGLEWVKALWIDKEPCADMDDEEAAVYMAERDLYHFTPALATDNPHLLKNDPGYIDRLKGQPAHIRRALLEGRWDALPGAYYTCWKPDQHVIRGIELENGRRMRPAEVMGLKDWHSRWVVIDYGWTHHAAVYWNAMVDRIGFTYRELMAKRTTPKALGELVGMISAKTEERIRRIYMGPDSFAERHAAHTIAQEFSEAVKPYHLPPAERAADDRQGGALLCYQVLESGLWVVSEECKRLVKSIPSRQVDPEKERDVLKIPGSDLDDAYDSWRYGVYSELRATREKPVDEQVEERVTSTDPTIAMGQRLKAQYDLRQRHRPARMKPRRW